MSEETLKDSEATVQAARKKVDEAPIMPFGDDDPPESPDESGGAVAEHGQRPLEDADRPVDDTGDPYAAEDGDRAVDVGDGDRD